MGRVEVSLDGLASNGVGPGFPLQLPRPLLLLFEGRLLRQELTLEGLCVNKREREREREKQFINKTYDEKLTLLNRSTIAEKRKFNLCKNFAIIPVLTQLVQTQYEQENMYTPMHGVSKYIYTNTWVHVRVHFAWGVGLEM